MEDERAPENGSEDIPEDVRQRIESAETADDDGRLELLEEMHDELEAEIDQTNPSGR